MVCSPSPRGPASWRALRTPSSRSLALSRSACPSRALAPALPPPPQRLLAVAVVLAAAAVVVGPALGGLAALAGPGLTRAAAALAAAAAGVFEDRAHRVVALVQSVVVLVVAGVTLVELVLVKRAAARPGPALDLAAAAAALPAA